MTEERVKRKLSAILSADAAGYSRLMGEDEVSTVRTLESYRKVMADLIEEFRGRVVDSPGDNLLAEFSSVVDAVQCAVEIHEVIRAKNEELPEDRRMLFRLGVNLGDVIEEGNRIYGDGVNIAARLEGLAEAGGICISGSAYEQIKNKLALGYEYIGEHAVKNIAEPLKVYRVPMGPKAVTPREENEKKTKLKNWQWTALGAAGAIIVIIGALAIWNFYSRGPSIELAPIEPEQAPAVSEVVKTKKTIAVLPFADLSPEKDQEYFVDGLSEEILNSLAQIPDLNVTARTSSFSFKGSNKTVQEIANILGADHILEGSVRKAGNELRVTAQLIRAADGIHLWSKTYDRELKDIFAVQEGIAMAVANELKITLGIGKSLKQLGGTDNVEAYEIYLISLGQAGTIVDPEEYSRSLKSIDAAITLDPKFALAWAYKAKVHWDLAVWGPSNLAAAEQDASLKAAQKAIELEPGLGQAYLSLGASKIERGEFIEASLAYRKGMELTSESADYYEYGVSIFYCMVGYLKRFNEFLESAKLKDPLNKGIRGDYIRSLGNLGEMQLAEEDYKRSTTLFGGQWEFGEGVITHLRLGTKDGVSKDEMPKGPVWDKAKEHLESPGEALVELRRLYNDKYALSSAAEFGLMACWAAYFGDPEFAMDAFEKAERIEATTLINIWLPVMKDVRKTPRFKQFVKKIGLVDYWNKFGWPDLCHPTENGDFECD